MFVRLRLLFHLLSDLKVVFEYLVVRQVLQE
jgi:hypothetical protein